MTTLECIALGILVGLMTWVLWALSSKAEELVPLIRFLPESLVEAWEEEADAGAITRRTATEGEPHRIVDQKGMGSAGRTTAKSSLLMLARASHCRRMND